MEGIITRQLTLTIVIYCFVRNIFLLKAEVVVKRAESNHVDMTSVNRPSTHSQMALVPYDDSKVLDMHRGERKFHFGVHDVVINQDWKGVGVAAVVWDAAVVLGEYLADHPDKISGLRVLELGAGTGLVGIVAAKLGGTVDITDRRLALKPLQDNVKLNTKIKNKDETTEDISANVQVKELDWGSNHKSYTANYDVILGADIIYIEETFPMLLETLLHLCNKNTLLLLSCRIRYHRDNIFLSMLKQHFTVSEVLYDKKRDIHIFSCFKSTRDDL